MSQPFATTLILLHAHDLSFQRLSQPGPHQYLRDLPSLFHHAPHLLHPWPQPSSLLTVVVRSMFLVDLRQLSGIGSLRPHSRRTIRPMPEGAKKSLGI